MPWRVAIVVAVLLTGAARAEQSVEVDPWEVHYSAITTDALQPAVARSYGITRSRSRVMLNVTVLRRDGERTFAMPAEIEASANNGSGQLLPIRMRAVEEGEARYYLGFVRVEDEDTLAFDVSVLPEGAVRPIEIRFDQQFFAR